MSRRAFAIFTVVLGLSALVFLGCKARTEKAPAEMGMETNPTMTSMEGMEGIAVRKPSQTIATETIPPTAAPQITSVPAISVESANRNKDIQIALKSAGYYTGAIDGNVGPKTKRAIEEFQAAKGLKVDGKVGPKTWNELEKYLVER